jgi:hypothetical protein
MADGVRTPRSRGTLSGLALILLGGWGGVAPFAGPSYGFGFTPDQAWKYTSGRLYLSAVPGAVVLLAGLIIAVTRSRGFGGFWAFVAALGGAWFIAGAAVIGLLPASSAAGITTGSPLGTSAHNAILTELALFAGVGALIVFFAAVALGRFSIAAFRDYNGVAADDVDVASIAGVGGAYGGYQQAQQVQQVQQPYAGQQIAAQYGSTEPFPPEHYASPTEQYQATENFPGTEHYQATEQYPPATQQQYQPGGAQYPQHDPFGLSQESPTNTYQRSQSPFPPAPFPGYPDQPASESTTALDRPQGDQAQ